MKSKKEIAKRSKAAENGGESGSKHKASQKSKKAKRIEPTANELMLKAWKKLYEGRQDRLL
jgi:ribosomal protein L35